MGGNLSTVFSTGVNQDLSGCLPVNQRCRLRPLQGNVVDKIEATVKFSGGSALDEMGRRFLATSTPIDGTVTTQLFVFGSIDFLSVVVLKK